MKAFALFLVLQSLFFRCIADVGSLRNLQTLGNVVRFELINGLTQEKIGNLYNKVVIDVSSISGMAEPSFNVKAVLSGGAAVVVFDYQTTSKYHVESSSPYTLCSGAKCSVLTYGTHTVQATTYSSASLSSATAGKKLSVTFVIRRSSAPALPVTSLQLMHTSVSPNKAIMDLKFGTTNIIDLKKLGLSDARFNIQAITSSAVQSVMFSNGIIETSKPLAYCRNVDDQFVTCDDLVVGVTKNITVTGYPLAGAAGTPYPIQWAAIQIVKPNPPEPEPSTPKPVPSTPKPVPIAPKPVPIAPKSVPVLLVTCKIPKMLDTTWWSTPSAPYPITVAEAQGSMIGRDFVIFSGFKNGYDTATTETYALDMSSPNAQWRRMDDMPFPLGLTHLGIAVNGMKAYLCGGYVGGSLGTHAGNCFVYDHSKPARSGQQWTSFAPLPMGGRSGGGMIYDSTMNAIVYAAGSQRPIEGENSAIDFTNTWMYSLNNPNAGWVSKANIPFHGNHMNFVTAVDNTGKERHYFFGGQNADNEATGNTATMFEYVATTDQWIRRASMPFPRGHSAAASRAIGCGFIVAGGRTNTGLTNDISYYHIPTNKWRSIGTLPVEIHTNVCIVYDDMLRCETGWAQGSFTSQRQISM